MPSDHSKYACGRTPVASRIASRIAAIAFGAAGLSARSTRCPSTSTPCTCSISRNSDGSTTLISRNSTSARPGTGLSRRCASSFSSYSAASPAPMRLAIMLSRPSCTSESAMNRRAASSNSIVSARISVVRVTREIDRDDDDAEDEQGRDREPVGLLDHVVHERVAEDQASARCTRRRERLPAADGGDQHRDRRRHHHGQDAGGVRAGLRIDIRLERDRDDHADRRCTRARPGGSPGSIRAPSRTSGGTGARY